MAFELGPVGQRPRGIISHCSWVLFCLPCHHLHRVLSDCLPSQRCDPLSVSHTSATSALSTGLGFFDRPQTMTTASPCPRVLRVLRLLFIVLRHGLSGLEDGHLLPTEGAASPAAETNNPSQGPQTKDVLYTLTP